MTCRASDERGGCDDGRSTSNADDADAIWETIRHLPETYRVPLVLQIAGGYAPIDIATLLGSNAATVRTRLYRARAQFRAMYERPA
jgi:DNA-directed RNA polymerase specialized sigma24 family protein